MTHASHSFLIACKFLDDVFYSNEYYARIGGVSVRELNILEVHMLKHIGFNLVVADEEFDTYVAAISKVMKEMNEPECVVASPPPVPVQDAPDAGTDPVSCVAT